MECKARLVDVSRSLVGAFRLTFETQDDVGQFVDENRERDLRLETKIWRNKRSLNANAYYYVLAHKIAQRLKSGATEVCNQLIADYGQPDTEIGHIILRSDVDWRKIETIHLRPTTKARTLDNGETYRVYYVMRGSHTYDTAEMAALIDGTVSEAKDLGIETMTPAELEAMKRAWKASYASGGSAMSAEEEGTNCTTAFMVPTGSSLTMTG